MKSLHIFTLAGTMGALVLFSGSTARAYVSYPNYYGDAATSIAIGSLNGSNRIVWRRHSDGACRSQTFGNAIGLAEDTNIYGGNGDDVAIIVENSSTATLCGLTLGPPKYGIQYRLFYNARSGKDIVIGDKKAVTFTEGGGGDILLTRASATALVDASWLFALGGQARLSGSNGGDVFCDMSGEGSFAAAGGLGGTDYIWGTARSMSSIEVKLPASDTSCSSGYYQTLWYISSIW